MVFQIAIALVRLAPLAYRWTPAALAALRELQRRQLSVADLNQLREALVATGNSAFVQYLGEIAEHL